MAYNIQYTNSVTLYRNGQMQYCLLDQINKIEEERGTQRHAYETEGKLVPEERQS
jgi:hypothetical protein